MKLLLSSENVFFNANSMKDLFEYIHIDDILSILREIKSYQKSSHVPDQYYRK